MRPRPRSHLSREWRQLDQTCNYRCAAERPLSPALRWALQNNMRVMDTHDLLEAAEALRAHTLQDVAQRIKGDVLIFPGEDDRFVPVDQVKQFEN